MINYCFQDLLANTDLLVTQARQLQQDIQDVLYLNDLLCMLQGRLEDVTPRRWPFLIAQDNVLDKVNLVI